ncbi:DNAse I-like superfamily protein [Euphorbia peplus]|nr:DNAse I-like superfamily protein [Euphorbia peplus]
MNFKTFVWNCQGTVNARFLRTLKMFLQNHSPSVIVLVETKCSGRIADSVIKKIGFDFSHRVEAIGYSGGIWTLWNNLFSIKIVASSWQFVHMQVHSPFTDTFFFTAVYGSPNPVRRINLWEGLKSMAPQTRGPWLLAGDFNATLCSEDKRGGSVRRPGGCPNFQEFMSSMSLHDFGFTGPRFTWKRGLLLERLDRVVGNSDWLQKFPRTVVNHLPRIKSDHRPLLIHTLPMAPQTSERPFRFIHAWLDHPGLLSFIANCWDSSMSFLSNTKQRSKSLDRWNIEVFGNIQRRKKRLLNKLKGLQSALEITSSPTLIAAESQVLQELESTLKQEEDLWQQKSRSKWIHEGDRNTAYFHNSTIARRRKNFISGLKIEGDTWCVNDIEIREAAVDFYKNLFSDDNKSPLELCRTDSFPILTPQVFEGMDGQPTDDEIRNALFQMHPWKAPGIDGFQAGVYQKNWAIMKNSLCALVKKAFREGSFDTELNKTLLVLIPKKPMPETFSDLRPISLCNVAYKVITKIIANRLKPLMPQLVLPQQTSFVAGRNITDNIIIAQEAIHSMRKKNGKSGWMALKVDLEKAYDRLRWVFIRDSLQAMGLPTKLISLVMFCISSVSLQIMWNGSPTPPFFPSRGIRQGDPLSPYICVLCMERLAHQIEGKCRLGLWKPLCFGGNQVRLSHLFFADDLLLFAQANRSQASVIKETLQEFCNASGHKVSASKSNIFFSDNLPNRYREEVLHILDFRPTSDLGKYLGVPLIHSRITRGTYQYILDGIRGKLLGWAANTLSFAGRITLAKAVLSAIPYFSMQTACLPVYVCSKIDELIRAFLWGSTRDARKISLVKWEEVCSPVVCGGLGMRNSQTMNCAFISKLGFNFIAQPDLFWVRILTAKYKTEIIPDPTKASLANSSVLWKAMSRNKSNLHIGIKWSVGDGKKSRFWTDNWVGDLGPLYLLAFGPIPENLIHLRVTDMVDNTGMWKWDSFKHLLPNSCLFLIAAALPCPITPHTDQVFWMGSSSGKFSVKSAYSMMVDDSAPSLRMWKTIWQWPGPQRIRCFIWLVTKRRILTNPERKRRHLSDEDLCQICNLYPETITHVFRDCPFARSVWLRLLHHNEFNEFISIDEANWFQESRTINDIVTSINIISKGILNSYETSLRHHNPQRACREKHLIGWNPPPPNWVKLNSDGAVKRDFGNASAGGLLRDCTGAWIHGFAKKIGSCSVLKAELWGIYEGLNLAWNLGHKKITVEVDSKLSVDLITRPSMQANDSADLINAIKDIMKRNWMLLPRPPRSLIVILEQDIMGVSFPRSCIV